MNPKAIQHLRQKLAADQAVYGIWVTLESASITEMAVALGLDWVIIDAEHGHLDWHDVLEHLRTTVRSSTVALVRLAELNCGLIKRALDIGADGVVIPWIETPEQLEQAVAFSKYPPQGIRGCGGERATGWGTRLAEHVDYANDHVLVVPIVESVKGSENIEQLCQVPGVELFYQGPADFSSTAGYAGQWEGPGIAEKVVAITNTIRATGKNCGVIATSRENLTLRQEQGFRMIGLGLDASLLLRSIRNMLAAAGQDREINTLFESELL